MLRVARACDPLFGMIIREIRSGPIVRREETTVQVLAEPGRSTLPNSLLGKAIRSALTQWDNVVVSLEDGRLRPDNHLAKNAIRPFAVGRSAFCHQS